MRAARGPVLRFRGPAVGSAMALGAGLLWSFGAVTARLADGADTFQYLLWRSIGIIVIVEAWQLLRGRRLLLGTAYTSGTRMLLAHTCLLVASLGFVYAVKTTSAATAAFLGSTTPLFGVLASRVFLGERITWRTCVAIGVAFVGLFIMIDGELDAGNGIGNLCAIVAAIGFAAYTTVVRSDPTRDWSPVMPGYAVVMIVVCAATVLSGDAGLAPGASDIAWALVHGGVFIVAGTTLYNGASKTVPAGAMTVFAQSEMVLVPVWAFLVLAERPSTSTMIGGAIIAAAVLGKAVVDAAVGDDGTSANRSLLRRPIAPTTTAVGAAAVRGSGDVHRLQSPGGEPQRDGGGHERDGDGRAEGEVTELEVDLGDRREDGAGVAPHREPGGEVAERGHDALPDQHVPEPPHDRVLQQEPDQHEQRRVGDQPDHAGEQRRRDQRTTGVEPDRGHGEGNQDEGRADRERCQPRTDDDRPAVHRA